MSAAMSRARAAVAGAIAATVVAMTGAPTASASTQDDEFLDRARANHFVSDDPAASIAFAHKVCLALDSGYTVNQIAWDMTTEFGEMTFTRNKDLVNIMRDVYCPGMVMAAADTPSGVVAVKSKVKFWAIALAELLGGMVLGLPEPLQLHPLEPEED